MWWIWQIRKEKVWVLPSHLSLLALEMWVTPIFLCSSQAYKEFQAGAKPPGMWKTLLGVLSPIRSTTNLPNCESSTSMKHVPLTLHCRNNDYCRIVSFQTHLLYLFLVIWLLWFDVMCSYVTPLLLQFVGLTNHLCYNT